MAYGNDEGVRKRVPAKSSRQPLKMDMDERNRRSSSGKFLPRKSSGTPSAPSVTKNGVLPAIQPARKKPLGGVYGD